MRKNKQEQVLINFVNTLERIYKGHAPISIDGMYTEPLVTGDYIFFLNSIRIYQRLEEMKNGYQN